MTKRKTTNEEIERVAERIFNSGKLIRDRNDFNRVFAKNIAGTDLTAAQKEFRENVFSRYEKQHPEVKVPEERKKIARKSGLSKKEFEKIEKKFRNIDIPARERTKKGTFRVVFAEKTSVIINKKSVVRYRDAKGRFASVRRVKK